MFILILKLMALSFHLQRTRIWVSIGLKNRLHLPRLNRCTHRLRERSAAHLHLVFHLTLEGVLQSAWARFR